MINSPLLILMGTLFEKGMLKYSNILPSHRLLSFCTMYKPKWADSQQWFL